MMRTVLISRDASVIAAARAGLGENCVTVFDDWTTALDQSAGVDLMVVDLLATLDEPGRIAGYERFALAKMDHPVAQSIPVVLLAPPSEVELDYMTGWPDFLFAQVRLPVMPDAFRRISRWIEP